ncbi:DUF3808 domain-containing protein [Hymenobacter ginkgonis]|uniref:DUF3808 domain-containing protein n=1 Tax=Hymenobacter ginkgonis TaxID=2682976 RepID=UPI0018DB15F9|nr:DUF3808 domain-containing protein [Hymenobacter ginkgonis]
MSTSASLGEIHCALQPELPTQPTPLEAAVGPVLSPGARRAYAEVLKLRIPAAGQLLAAEPASAPGTLLVADCADFVALMISQDAGRYEAAIAAQDARLAMLEKIPASAVRDYTQAEIRLHQAVSQLVFNHELRGAWNLRQTVGLLQTAAYRYPSFIPLRKSLGMCQFGIGSLPEGYHWLLKILGLNSSVEEGLQNLTLAATRPHDFQTESRIVLALIQETYYKRPADAVALMESLRHEQPDNLLFSYLVISLNKRQHHTDDALAAYRARPTGPAYLPVAYLHHMAADLLLYQGDYRGSEAENQQFLREYRGQHYRKDAAFKLYLVAWLSGQPAATVERYRQQINLAGPLILEEDIYAQRFYHDALPLNLTLTRARFQTDGGYYQLALSTLHKFEPSSSTPTREQLELLYRRARVWQGLLRTDSARLDYLRTVRLAAALGRPPYYFAPQAALQLGYLAQTAGQRAAAKTYFEQALAYPKHEYKNSTDQKAKLALREL